MVGFTAARGAISLLTFSLPPSPTMSESLSQLLTSSLSRARESSLALAARRYRSSRDRSTTMEELNARSNAAGSISRIAERRIAPRVFVNIGCYRHAGNVPEIGPAPCVRTIRTILYHRYRCVFRNPPPRYLRAHVNVRVRRVSSIVVNTCLSLSLSLSLC